MRMNEYTSKDFDNFAEILIGRWEFALELEPRWDSLDDEERIAHTEDWPVNNGILMDLEDYADSHELTEGQQVQWSKLKDIMAKHRKTLEEMGYRVLPLKEERGRAVA